MLAGTVPIFCDIIYNLARYERFFFTIAIAVLHATHQVKRSVGFYCYIVPLVIDFNFKHFF